MNSIVVPVYGDHSCPNIAKLCEGFSRGNFEVIVVSGCDSPEIKKTVASFGYRYIQFDGEQGRGSRMHEGFLASSGEVVLFHHPRSVIDPEGLEYFSSMKDQNQWGGFTHKFDFDHPFLRWTSWYSNRGRALRGVLYLDHCIYASKSLLELIDGVPKLEIFEDTELCIRLRRYSKPELLPYYSTTSSIRFRQNGFFKQAMINQFMKFGFYFRMPKRMMNRHYEKNISLNSDYDKKDLE